MANFFDEDTFDFQASSAHGRSRVDTDAEINEREFFEEKTIFKNLNSKNNQDYAQGKTKKRKKKVNFKRADELNFNADEEDQMADFDSNKNPHYEDAYTEENLRNVKRDMKMTDKDKEKLKQGFSAVLSRKKMNMGDNSGTNKMSALKTSNNLTEFLKNVGKIPSKDNETITKNEDWLFSNERNKDKIAGVESSEAGSEGSLLRKKIKIKNTNKDWFEERFDKNEKIDPKTLGKDDAGVEEQEYEIKVKRSEFNYMQQLTEKLYGKSIDEEQYLEMVSKKFKGDTKEKSKINALDISKELETLNDSYVADLDLEDTFDVQKDSQKIKKSSAAMNGDNIVPDIDWGKTLYAKYSIKKLRESDPFGFILNVDAREELIDDDKVFIPLECAVKRLALNTTDEEKCFSNVKEWFTYLNMCDIYHTDTKTYPFKGVPEDVSHPGSLRAPGASLSKSSKKAKTTEKTLPVSRLVIYHDLKNGFFICNHFELQRKKNTREDENKFNFIWLNYCYLECINRKE